MHVYSYIYLHTISNQSNRRSIQTFSIHLYLLKLELDKEGDITVTFKIEYNKLAEYLNILRGETLEGGEK